MKRTIVNPLFKDVITFIKTSGESKGKVSEMELTLQPSGKNPSHYPLHYHKSYAETFTAIDSEVGVGLGKKEVKILKPGDTYTVEPNNLHYYFNPIDREIKFKVEIRPGHEGFENSLRILFGLAADDLTNKKGVPKSIQHTAVIAIMADMNLPGLFTLMFPLLKRIARKAKDSGVEQQLIDKYCQ